jgi:hypothetical protein
MPKSLCANYLCAKVCCFQALEVAGQVAGTSVTTSPLPYNTMASQCEALGTGTRKKLSNWLAHESLQSRLADKSSPTSPENGHLALKRVSLLFNLFILLRIFHTFH